MINIGLSLLWYHFLPLKMVVLWLCGDVVGQTLAPKSCVKEQTQGYCLSRHEKMFLNIVAECTNVPCFLVNPFPSWVSRCELAPSWERACQPALHPLKHLLVWPLAQHFKTRGVPTISPLNHRNSLFWDQGRTVSLNWEFIFLDHSD